MTTTGSTAGQGRLAETSHSVLYLQHAFSSVANLTKNQSSSNAKARTHVSQKPKTLELELDWSKTQ
jgi:hypothetical protein